MKWGHKRGNPKKKELDYRNGKEALNRGNR
jgi:hypothetical protein